MMLQIYPPQTWGQVSVCVEGDSTIHYQLTIFTNIPINHKYILATFV